MAMIRLLLVDDQPAVRHGLRMRLALEPDLLIIGEAGDGEAALAQASMLHPDVVLMDIRMPGMDGLSVTVALRGMVPESAVVILSLYDDDLTRAQAQAAGSLAFVAKQEPVETLLAAIREASGKVSQSTRQDHAIGVRG